MKRTGILILTVGLWGAASFLGAEDSQDRMIQVQVEVNYGSQDIPPVKKRVWLKPGSTVVDATRAAAKLKQGVVCCDPRDVEAINGVECDAKKKSWWIYDLNGKKGSTGAYNCRLQNGDRVTWNYQVMAIVCRPPVIPSPSGKP
jgi:hypothetical protein